MPSPASSPLVLPRTVPMRPSRTRSLSRIYHLLPTNTGRRISPMAPRHKTPIHDMPILRPTRLILLQMGSSSSPKPIRSSRNVRRPNVLAAQMVTMIHLPPQAPLASEGRSASRMTCRHHHLLITRNQPHLNVGEDCPTESRSVVTRFRSKTTRRKRKKRTPRDLLRRYPHPR